MKAALDQCIVLVRVCNDYNVSTFTDLITRGIHISRMVLTSTDLIIHYLIITVVHASSVWS